MQTQRYVPSVSGACLVLLEDDRIRICELDSRQEWKVGRYDPSIPNPPDILFSSGIVSREHGWLRNIDDRWYFVDNPGNLNGTYHNGVKIPRTSGTAQQSVALENGDILRIDSPDLNRAHTQGVLMLFTTAPVPGTWTLLPLEHRTITIGRDPGCDIVEPVPYISAHHAQITYSDGIYRLSDLGSSAGTYLNGKKITESVVLREKDCIHLCDSSYFFLGSKLLYAKRNRQKEHAQLVMTEPSQRPVVLRADIDVKAVKDNNGNGMKELIRDIHLEIRQGTLVALLGTAGAGKTTVMNCLNGMDLAGVRGTVMFRDVDLMKHFDRMKYLIGSVPQKKTFHLTFTPEQEFRLAARKRLPADTSKDEIEKRVEQTLQMLSMTGVRKNRNSKLSGGEQTRVNVGIELVADRELLCLDEPDQGLSPNYKHELFEIMGNLAHSNGKSVLTIIHDVSEIDLFDQVIMLVKAGGVGRLAFSGTPEEARAYFGVADLRDAYSLLEKDPDKYVR